MKKLTKYLFYALTSAIILLQANVASAALIELNYNNTVTVGETFNVDVILDIPAGLELSEFGFNVDIGAGNVSFDNVNYAAFLTGDILNDVSAYLTNPFASISGDDILLATLTFTADTVGSNVVSLTGDAFNFGGLFLLDPTNGFAFVEEDINTSFNINVVAANPVPTPTAFSLLLLAVGGLIMSRKKLPFME